MVLIGLTAGAAAALGAPRLVWELLLWASLVGLLLVGISHPRLRTRFPSLGYLPFRIIYPSERSNHLLDPQSVVDATAYSLVSRKLAIDIKRDDSTLKVGMHFENVGPSHLRWEMETFRLGVEGAELPYAMYLTRSGTLGAEDPLLYECGHNKVDLTQVINGHLEFSFIYGPAQKPKARRLQEVWRFELTPDGQGGFTHHTYTARHSDEPC